MANPGTSIRAATEADVALILFFIRGLAEYEKLAHEVVATEQDLQDTLFGSKPSANVVIAENEGRAAGFALFFTSYSTFLGRPGIYLEDLFVLPDFRGKGIGKALLKHLAGLVVQGNMGRLDWSVLDWNTPAIEFYEQIGARGLKEWTQFRLDGDALKRLAST